MNIKCLTALVLALCLAFSLCACGGNTDNIEPSSTATNTLSVETTEATEPAEPSHTVKVVDEGGNPVAGAFVQICLDTCTPAQTDANGVASYFNMPDADYEVKLMTMPAGYDYISEEHVFHFDGSNQVTITLKAVA